MLQFEGRSALSMDAVICVICTNGVANQKHKSIPSDDIAVLHVVPFAPSKNSSGVCTAIVGNCFTLQWQAGNILRFLQVVSTLRWIPVGESRGISGVRSIYSTVIFVILRPEDWTAIAGNSRILASQHAAEKRSECAAPLV